MRQGCGARRRDQLLDRDQAGQVGQVQRDRTRYLDRVYAETAVYRIGHGEAVGEIAGHSVIKNVVARAAGDAVCTGAAGDDVDTAAADDRVIARATGEGVGTRAHAHDGCGSRHTGQVDHGSRTGIGVE